ncbi:MAG: outer membrane lipoprotein carrier protein LolA [Nitrospiraceae bacterium]
MRGSNRMMEQDGAGRRKRRAVICVCTVAVVLLGQGLWAEGSRAEEGKAAQEIKGVVKKIQARYEQTKDLQADFTQKTKVEGFATPITSSGRVFLKRPGRLRWDYVEPSREEIYVNQDDVKMYVPEHSQVLIGKLTQMAASQAPLQLLQGIGKIEEEFDLAPAPDQARGAGGLPLVVLTPKTKNQETARPFQQIVLEADPKTHYIKSLTLHELSGNVATFEFSSVKPNAGLQDGLFEFTAPADTEVVRAPSFRAP